MSSVDRSFTLTELAQRIGAELVGDPQAKISSLATLASAGPTDLSFIASPAYKKFLAASRAGAIICSPDLAHGIAGNKLILSNPYLGYARLSALFDTSQTHVAGVHPSAVIGEHCILGQDICIQANVVLGDYVTLGDGVSLGGGTGVGSACHIGARTKLYPNVTLYHGVYLGEDAIVHSGCVLGADGFGFSPSAEGWVKIHQLGGLTIGNRVEIGANSTIDRGALEDTFIDDGVIIDNLVQIGHNVRLGKNTAVAAHTAIAGSTCIGENCTIAGAVAIAGHLHLADRVHITGMGMVSASISEAGSYSSGVPLGPTKEWRKNAARFFFAHPRHKPISFLG